MRRGLRFRLAVAIVALVALTAAVLGVGASVAVENALRGRVLAESGRDAAFDLSVLVPAALSGETANRAAFEASDLPDTFRRRGDLETIVDWGDADPYVSTPGLTGALGAIPADVRTTADAGRELAYAWTTISGRPSLVVGGRAPGVPATFWFVRDTSDVESALGTLRAALAAGAVILVAIALLVGRRLARGILRPIGDSADAAERIASGDLTARVPAGGGDELGAWAASFNRMAATLEETVARLRAAEAQNRRFVADVAHELRTPLAALVAEASLVRDSLDAGELGPADRRAAELLVADVGRLRALVEDLMELSRFDAAAEQPRHEPVDLGAVVRAIAAVRAPEARVVVPPEPLLVSSEPRRLDRIVGNLLDNAREHAPDAAVEVTVERDQEAAVVAVRDRGPGVAAAALPHLFERFWKGDPARTSVGHGTDGAHGTGGSSGLGLAIAAEHAALLGGTLVASLPPGGGLRVALRLPIEGVGPESPPVSESLPAGDGPVTPTPEAVRRSDPASGRVLQ